MNPALVPDQQACLERSVWFVLPCHFDIAHSTSDNHNQPA
jgi:hypothetical protein